MNCPLGADILVASEWRQRLLSLTLGDGTLLDKRRQLLLSESHMAGHVFVVAELSHDRAGRKPPQDWRSRVTALLLLLHGRSESAADGDKTGTCTPCCPRFLDLRYKHSSRKVYINRKDLKR